MSPVVLTIFLSVTPVLFAQQAQWEEKKTTHFIIHYKNADEGFVDKVAQESEEYYNTIADNLGFTRFDFWLWDARAHVYVYDDANEYQRITGLPSWSLGATIPNSKIIYAYPEANDFFDKVLPHEMGHIIFREFVGFYNHAVPDWLDEGVACYQMDVHDSGTQAIVRRAVENNNYISISRLSGLSPRFMNSKEVINLFYAEATSIVEYLLSEFGRDKFVDFCSSLRDTRSLQEALRITYSFGSFQELEDAWCKFVKNA